MKIVRGWHLPEWDTHYGKWFKDEYGKEDLDVKREYQIKQRSYAMSYVQTFENAIDAGGNVGFWAEDMCKKFKHVHIFEPHPDNIECLKANLEPYNNKTIYEVGLSNKAADDVDLFFDVHGCGNASLNLQGITESTQDVVEGIDKTKTSIKRLDDYNLEFISFYKIDCQVHEFEILEGSMETLKRSRAVLCLELPRRNQREKDYHLRISNLLSKIGYRMIGAQKKETVWTK